MRARRSRGARLRSRRCSGPIGSAAPRDGTGIGHSLPKVTGAPGLWSSTSWRPSWRLRSLSSLLGTPEVAPLLDIRPRCGGMSMRDSSWHCPDGTDAPLSGDARSRRSPKRYRRVATAPSPTARRTGSVTRGARWSAASPPLLPTRAIRRHSGADLKMWVHSRTGFLRAGWVFPGTQKQDLSHPAGCDRHPPSQSKRSATCHLAASMRDFGQSRPPP